MEPVTSWRFGFSINAQAISVRQRIDVVKLGVNHKLDWGGHRRAALMSDVTK
jgi:hypothetical protein